VKDFSVYGLDPSLFPELVPMATVAGEVTAQASARTGLAEGTPVIAVGSDFMAALLGSGAVAPGRVCDRAGTSEGINYCAVAPSGDPRLRDLPHVIPPFWNAAAILSSTGALFEWYRRITGQENYTYEDTLSAIARTPAAASSPLFFPGPRDGGLWEFSDGGFLRLDPRHDRGEMGRAVMEAIGFAVRRGIEILESAGLPVEEMRITGGQARGRFWNRMKADITGRRLLIPEIEDAELAGGVCAAAVALGRYDSLAEASEALITIKQVYDPDPEAAKVYDDAYARYRESAEAYKRLFPGEGETRAD
jgi:xylulokinase